MKRHPNPDKLCKGVFVGTFLQGFLCPKIASLCLTSAVVCVNELEAF